MLYVMICYKSMTSDYCFHTSNILKKQQTLSQNHKFSSFEITKESIQVVLKCKNTLLSTNFFRMLYVMICYKSMTSDYCFHTSNILKKQQTSSQNHKISSFEITKESIQVILKCNNTLLSTKLFQNVICNDMLQINDLIVIFLVQIKKKQISSSQKYKFTYFEIQKESVKVYLELQTIQSLLQNFGILKVIIVTFKSMHLDKDNLF